MARLRQILTSNGMKQVDAARWFRVSQSRISHLMTNRVSRFSVDTLVNMLAHAGVGVDVRFTASPNTPRVDDHDTAA